MRYFELKSIIKHIKKNVQCQECKNTFKEKDFNILGLVQDSVLIDLGCPECEHHTMVQVSLLWDGQEVAYKHNTLGFSGEPITRDEVLDMHNFLKKFDGDFAEYLKKK